MHRQNSLKVAQKTESQGQRKRCQWLHDCVAALGILGLVACISTEPLTWQVVLLAACFGMLAFYGTRGYRE